MACKAAGISTSTFYEWAQEAAHGPSTRDWEEAHLVDAIISIHRASNGVYGSPTITAELRAHGWEVNHKRVERLMRDNGIQGMYKPAKVRTTIPAELNPPVPDLVKRAFSPGRPDCTWVGDITYIPTGEGWLYLSSVLDLGSRKLIGYSMADHMRTELVADALNMAVGLRGGNVEGVTFHADRGSQYLSEEFRALLAELGMNQSVGRIGVCWDNAVAESFWSGLKRELVHRYQFAPRPKPDGRSSPGSTGTTRHADTQHWATSAQTNGKPSTLRTTQTATTRPHNHVSGKRGDPQSSARLFSWFSHLLLCGACR